MMRALLAERFKLVVREETHQVPVFVLYEHSFQSVLFSLGLTSVIVGDSELAQFRAVNIEPDYRRQDSDAPSH